MPAEYVFVFDGGSLVLTWMLEHLVVPDFCAIFTDVKIEDGNRKNKTRNGLNLTDHAAVSRHCYSSAIFSFSFICSSLASCSPLHSLATIRSLPDKWGMKLFCRASVDGFIHDIQ